MGFFIAGGHLWSITPANTRLHCNFIYIFSTSLKYISTRLYNKHKIVLSIGMRSIILTIHTQKYYYL